MSTGAKRVQGLSRTCLADAARDFDNAMRLAGRQDMVNTTVAWEKWQAMQLTGK